MENDRERTGGFRADVWASDLALGRCLLTRHRYSERNAMLASRLREKYQSSAASNSNHASGWRRYGLGFGIAQPSLQAAEHLFAGNRLHSSRANIVHAALDLFVPCGFDAFFRSVLSIFIEASDQTMHEHTAILRRKGKRLFQKFRKLGRDVCRDGLRASSVYTRVVGLPSANALRPAQQGRARLPVVPHELLRAIFILTTGSCACP